MADRIELEIVTPSRKVLQESCEDVYLPGPNGEMGILPEHARLVATLPAGCVRYRIKEQTKILAVRGGFVQVLDNRIMVLADEAVQADEINKVALENERAELERKLVAADIGIDEREKLIAERNWIEARAAAIERPS